MSGPAEVGVQREADASQAVSKSRSQRRIRSRRLAPVVLCAALLAVAGSIAPGRAAPAAAASSTKVVIVVGPVGDSQTAEYISNANAAAAVARKYTSNVTTIYSPHATWSRVKTAAQGANILLYLGHGNGFPSPYSSVLNKSSMDGFGLNATDNNGNYNWAYYGENYITGNIRFAPNAVVLFSRLCYASGDSEWGAGTPTLGVAQARVVNYAAPWITAGARAVIADGLGDIGWYISALFTRHSSIDSLFRGAPNTFNNVKTFASVRNAGYTAYMDVGTYSYVPDRDPYYRSMVAVPSLSTDSVVGVTAQAPRPATLVAKTRYSAVNIRRGATMGYAVVATVPAGTSMTVTGAIFLNASNWTWAPVRLSSGQTGWVATDYVVFTGSAVATAPLNVRSAKSTSAGVVAGIAQGARFTVTGSSTDAGHRAWLSVKTADGHTGYAASWFTAP